MFSTKEILKLKEQTTQNQFLFMNGFSILIYQIELVKHLYTRMIEWTMCVSLSTNTIATNTIALFPFGLWHSFEHFFRD